MMWQTMLAMLVWHAVLGFEPKPTPVDVTPAPLSWSEPGGDVVSLPHRFFAVVAYGRDAALPFAPSAVWPLATTGVGGDLLYEFYRPAHLRRGVFLSMYGGHGFVLGGLAYCTASMVAAQAAAPIAHSHEAAWFLAVRFPLGLSLALRPIKARLVAEVSPHFLFEALPRRMAAITASVGARFEF